MSCHIDLESLTSRQDCLVCVDGQQRLTTTSLFVSAVADLLARTGSCAEKVLEAEEFLFNNPQEMETLRNTSSTSITDFYPFLRLLPSELDRKPFLVAALGSRNGLVVTGNLNRK